MATAGRTELGLNDRARDIVERAGRRRRARSGWRHHAPGGRPGVQGGKAARAASTPAPRSAKSAWAGSATWPTRRSRWGRDMAGLTVWTDQPARAWPRSTPAGRSRWTNTLPWVGPAPAHARVERELFEKLEYAEEAAHGVVLETRTLPTDEVAAWVAQKARLRPSQLTFVVAPRPVSRAARRSPRASSRPGCTRWRRSASTSAASSSGIGTAPLPPVAKNDLRAIGRTNDCILYGGQAATPSGPGMRSWPSSRRRSPRRRRATTGRRSTRSSSATRAILQDRSLLFSPAEVWLTSIESGRTFHAGRLNAEVLTASCYPT